jgi:hypothetical protein
MSKLNYSLFLFHQARKDAATGLKTKAEINKN